MDTLPGLIDNDTLIFEKSCLKAMETNNDRIISKKIYQEIKDHEIKINDFNDSLEILDKNNYIKAMKLLNGTIPDFQITHYGFSIFFQNEINNYGEVHSKVCNSIIDENFKGDEILANELNQSIILIRHIIDDLTNEGLIKSQKIINGNHVISYISPDLKRKFG